MSLENWWLSRGENVNPFCLQDIDDISSEPKSGTYVHVNPMGNIKVSQNDQGCVLWGCQKHQSADTYSISNNIA